MVDPATRGAAKKGFGQPLAKQTARGTHVMGGHDTLLERRSDDVDVVEIQPKNGT